MKKSKRLFIMLLVLMMVISCLSGCKGATEESTQSTADKKGKVYYLNFKPEQADDWEELARKYTKETGVKVSVVTAASDEYETTLKSEMAKTESPTLFQVNGPVGLATWSDYCYDLKDTDVYKSLKSEEFALKSDEGEVLAVAYVIETYGIIYNRKLLNEYCATDGAVISNPEEITNFETLKAVAEDIQSKREELGILGAFTSAGMDPSSDWRFKTHLANIPIYYEYKDRGITSAEEVEGTYLDNYKAIWDLYINNSTTSPAMISSKTGEDAASEFALGEAVFYQNGTWAYGDIAGEELEDEDLGMLPIYIGVQGEENQGLTTGSENYWCINKKAKEEDIKATEDFIDWVISSEEGKETLAEEMGFVTPFRTFGDKNTAHNPLVKIAEDYINRGKTPVSWNFATIPSDKWKEDVGDALLEYAQGTGDWSAVETAFVDGWKREYDATHQ